MVEGKAVFIESGGETDGVWERDAEERFFETWIAVRGSLHEPVCDCGHGQVVYFFCVEAEEEGTD